MPSVFDNNVVRFQYPENWQVEGQDSEEGWTVSVQSPGTAFLLISCYTERPDVKDVLQASLQAMQQDYPELETEEAGERLAGHASKGYDISFFSLDTLNSCKLRCFRTASATFLFLSQSSSFDSETNVAVIDAIRQTVQLTD